MKLLMIALMALVGSLSLADAAVRLPQPKPAESLAQAAPKFEFPDRTTPAPTAPAPTQAAPTQPPVVVNMPAAPVPEKNGLIDWIHTALLGLLTAIGGKLAFKLPEMPGAAKLDHSKVQDIVASVLNPEKAASIIKDPNLKASVDLALFKAIQSGIPGQALQTGLSFVPGAGPIVTTVEPIVRKIVLDILQQEKSGATLDPNAVHAETDNRITSILDMLKGLRDKLNEKHA